MQCSAVQCSVSAGAGAGRCPFVPGVCPMVPGRCPTVLGGCPTVQGWCSIMPGRCPMVLLRYPIVPGRCLLTTVYCQRVLHCKRVPSHLKKIFETVGLRLGLLGCQLIDIGMKLYLVHLSAVNFSSALAVPRLWRT